MTYSSPEGEDSFESPPPPTQVPPEELTSNANSTKQAPAVSPKPAQISGDHDAGDDTKHDNGPATSAADDEGTAPERHSGLFIGQILTSKRFSTQERAGRLGINSGSRFAI